MSFPTFSPHTTTEITVGSLPRRWGNHTFTGHNSPLYARDDELDEESPGFQMNTDFSMRYWQAGGAKKSQLLLGMGAYGRGFRLTDPADHGIYSPASGGSEAGKYTGTAGIIGYNEYCEKLFKDGEAPLWTQVRVSASEIFTKHLFESTRVQLCVKRLQSGRTSSTYNLT